MANTDFPSGFMPIYRKGGGCPVSTDYDLSPTNSAIGLYDLLERRADGYLDQAQVGSTTIVGIAAQSVDANTGGQIPVYDVDDHIMVAQVDDASVDQQTDFDLNYNIVVGAPNSVTGRSIMEIDGSSGAANVDLPIKLMRVAQAQDATGNVLGEFVKVECYINRGIFKSGALG
jgi:hypothetical protein